MWRMHHPTPLTALCGECLPSLSPFLPDQPSDRVPVTRSYGQILLDFISKLLFVKREVVGDKHCVVYTTSTLVIQYEFNYNLSLAPRCSGRRNSWCMLHNERLWMRLCKLRITVWMYLGHLTLVHGLHYFWTTAGRLTNLSVSPGASMMRHMLWGVLRIMRVVCFGIIINMRDWLGQIYMMRCGTDRKRTVVVFALSITIGSSPVTVFSST